jgi:hypothetical protein
MVALASVARAKYIGQYIQRLEGYFQPCKDLGWERNIRHGKEMRTINYPTAAIIVFWVLVSGGSWLAAYQANEFLKGDPKTGPYPSCHSEGSR